MELITVLKDYLDTENTDYALLISGEWGCGKTHFLKNELFKTISDTRMNKPLRNKNIVSNFEPIYVSLFGIKETIEIDKRIILELNPRLKSKPAFIVNLLVNKLSGIVNFNWLKKEDLQDFLSIFNVPKNKVLCFDDLERINKNILDEALGYINAFVEHQNLKAIIVGDENILRGKVYDYDKTKEKLIRFTYSFSPDIHEIFNSFLGSYSENYTTFLKQNKAFICNILAKGKHKNLRTLRFSLDLLEKVYTNTESHVNNSKYRTEILDRLTFFTTLFSIEYKKINDREKLEELKQINSENILLASLPGIDDFLGKKKNQEIDIEKTSYKDDFVKTYLPFDNHYFNYFEVIANLAYTGFLNVDKLHKDISEIESELIRKETTRESILIQKMSNCFVLKDEEFIPLLEEVLEKVDEGLFDLTTYPNLFTTLLKIEYYHLEDFRIDESLMQKFERGIDKSKQRAKHLEAYRWKIPVWEPKEPRYSRISEYATQANESLLNIKIELRSSQLIPLIEKNMGDDLFNFLIESEFVNMPIFQYLDPVNILEKLKPSDNYLKYSFSNGLKERFKNNHSTESYKRELGFFVTSLDLLNSYLESQPRIRVSTIAFIELRKVINTIVTKPE